MEYFITVALIQAADVQPRMSLPPLSWLRHRPELQGISPVRWDEGGAIVDPPTFPRDTPAQVCAYQVCYVASSTALAAAFKAIPSVLEVWRSAESMKHRTHLIRKAEINQVQARSGVVGGVTLECRAEFKLSVTD